jgi:hypothetical protein
MKLLSLSALKKKFPKAENIVQVRVITKNRNVIEIEGPVSEKEGSQIIKLAIGDEKACGCGDSNCNDCAGATRP